MSNLPFGNASLLDPTDASYVNGRIIGFGYRITYISSESNKGGSYYAIQNPSRGSVNGFTSDNIGGASYANIRAIDRNRLQESIYPLTSNELDFTDERNTNSTTCYPMGDGSAYSATVIPAAAGVLIAPSAASSFMVELVVHAEFVGRGAAPYYTTTHVDPESWDLFQCALGELELARASFENGDSPSQRMGVVLDYLRQSAPHHRVTKTCQNLMGMLRSTERQSNRGAQHAGALIAIGPAGHF